MSSQEIALTDRHIKILEKYIAKFRAADTNLREKLIEEATDSIERAWGEDVEFDRDVVINVCEFSVTVKYAILKYL
jgi:hypothetical protein